MIGALGDTVGAGTAFLSVTISSPTFAHLVFVPNAFTVLPCLTSTRITNVIVFILMSILAVVPTSLASPGLVVQPRCFRRPSSSTSSLSLAFVFLIG